MDSLLTFVGFHDPFGNDSSKDGPVLSLMQLRPFSRVVLFDTPGARMSDDRTHRTAEIIHQRHPSTVVDVRTVQVDDPTDYTAILGALRPQLSSIREAADDEHDRFYVGLASGAPQMQTCWFLLVASSEFPAVLLQMHKPEHGGQYNEIDVRKPEFPVIHRHFGTFTTGEIEVDEELRDIGLVGSSRSLLEAVDRTYRFARAGLPIMLLGEPGTGKEMFATLAHRFSPRRNQDIVRMNCAAVQESLAESELFGAMKGAYTGAISDRMGKFKMADKGTLFLDEVGDLSLPIQAKILRALENNTIEPVGGKEITVDVRIIVATNKDLRGMVREKLFRQDLYDRLKGGTVRIPALRERKHDIELLAHHFLETAAKEKVFAASAIQKLRAHRWPGNIRELRNTIRQTVALSRSDCISADDIEIEQDDTFQPSIPEPHDGFNMRAYLAEARSTLIEKALELSKGNLSVAARLLGVTTQAISKYCAEK